MQIAVPRSFPQAITHLQPHNQLGAQVQQQSAVTTSHLMHGTVKLVRRLLAPQVYHRNREDQLHTALALATVLGRREVETVMEALEIATWMARHGTVPSMRSQVAAVSW